MTKAAIITIKIELFPRLRNIFQNLSPIIVNDKTVSCIITKEALPNRTDPVKFFKLH